MELQQFSPSDLLKPYIKYYYIFESDVAIEFDDIVVPSGEMELMFNLGGGTWEHSVGDKFLKTPQIELWGQITSPLSIRSKGKHIMLGVKFYPHSVLCFLDDEPGVFNDQITNFEDVIGKAGRILHGRLLETADRLERIKIIETFLLDKIRTNQWLIPRIEKVAGLLNSIKAHSAQNNLADIASKHGITSRYLHKLVYQCTGLSPTSFNKISRFQTALNLVVKNDEPLTVIAHQCGYFDQSHFIRDFKTYTGLTPSAYLQNITPINQLLQTEFTVTPENSTK